MRSIRNSDLAKLSELDTDKTIFAINFLINELIEKYNLSYEQVTGLISEKQEQLNPDLVPLHIFKERPLGILESLVKFLKEERNMGFKQISKLLNRNNKTIWSSYHNAVKKKAKRFAMKKARILVPLDIFSDRRLGLLESLSYYLKEKRHINFHNIGAALNRDERTIWTSYRAAKKKGSVDR